MDDAVLSAGGLLSHLSGKTNITLINIFTESGQKPYTRSIKNFLKKCGVDDAEELFLLRRKEEQHVAKMLNIESVNLGFIDGGFRRRKKMNILLKLTERILPEAGHLYPFVKKIFRLAKEDILLQETISKKLQDILPKKSTYLIFCPWGKVFHIDHEITRNVCEQLFSPIIFWADYPYIKNPKPTMRLHNILLEGFAWNNNAKEKNKLIAFYKTQIYSLFPDGRIPVIPEMYWILKEQNKDESLF
jgi:LmbE family N-acetylglucosaminyl deacetylase